VEAVSDFRLSPFVKCDFKKELLFLVWGCDALGPTNSVSLTLTQPAPSGRVTSVSINHFPVVSTLTKNK
jgi:hypothetical protein